MKQEKSKVILLIQILLIIGGIFSAIMFLLSTFKFISNPTNRSVTELNLILSFLTTACLALIAGIGLLKEKQFGWKFLNIYFIVSIFKAIVSSITIYANYSPSLYTKSREQLITKFIIRVIVYIILLFVIYKQNILSFFNIESNRKKTEFIKAIIISFVIVLIVNLLINFSKYVFLIVFVTNLIRRLTNVSAG